MGGGGGESVHRHNQSRGPGCVFESRFSAEDAEKKRGRNEKYGTQKVWTPR